MSQRNHSYYSRHSKRYRRSRRFPGKALAVALLLVVVCLVWFQAPWKAEGQQGKSEVYAAGTADVLGSSDVTGPHAATTAPAATALPELTVPVAVADVADTGYLALVNKDYPIDSELSSRLDEWLLTGELAPAVYTVPVLGDDILLQWEALQAVEDLIDAAKEADVHTLFICSGYRSYAEQAQLYREIADKTLVQPPNHSEHQTGLAIDIAIMGVDQSEMAGSLQGRWLADNAWRYGFVMRYPGDKQQVTHIASEPWHYRYVGLPHAWYCWQNNLCLEEYLTFLQESGGYSVNLDGIDYTVLYARPAQGLLSVPEDANLSISSDNTGGYVITVRE